MTAAKNHFVNLELFIPRTYVPKNADEAVQQSRLDLQVAEIEALAARELRKRLMGLRLKFSLEEQAQLTATFVNHDLFFIDDGIPYADQLLIPGNAFRLSFGYLEPDDLNASSDVSPTYVFNIIEVDEIASDSPITVTAVLEGQTTLGSRTFPRAFSARTVSSIVSQVLSENGFPEDKQRLIQPSNDIKEGIIQKANETHLAFINRMARTLNYKFFIERKESYEVAHFHKTGWVPTVDQSRLREGPSKSFGISGNFAPVELFLAYRSPDAVAGLGPVLPPSNMISWSLKQTPAGRATCIRSHGFDIQEGKIVHEEVCNKDLDSNSTSGASGLIGMVGDLFQAVQEVPKNSGDQNAAEAKEEAKATLEAFQMGTVTLTVNTLGMPKTRVGMMARVFGLKKFSGFYIVTEINHDLMGDFLTSFILSSDGVSGDPQDEDRPSTKGTVGEIGLTDDLLFQAVATPSTTSTPQSGE